MIIFQYLPNWCFAFLVCLLVSCSDRKEAQVEPIEEDITPATSNIEKIDSEDDQLITPGNANNIFSSSDDKSTAVPFQSEKAEFNFSRKIDYFESRTYHEDSPQQYKVVKRFHETRFNSFDKNLKDEIANTIAEWGFRRFRDDGVASYLIAVSDDGVSVIDTTIEAISLLGKIDTPAEAELWAWINSYSAIDKETTKVDKSGYRLVLKKEAECPQKVETVEVLVKTNGSITPLVAEGKKAEKLVSCE